MKFYILTATLLAVTSAATQKYTKPTAILKQIDKHNEDGSYTYGYEDADGTFKIETKYPDGEVYGKYGYIDDTGTLREVEYGASRRGFEPAGNEIQVAPPTLKSNQRAVARPLAPNEEDDGQYREDPAAYYKDDPYVQPRQNSYQQPTSRYQPEPQSYYQPEPEPASDFEFDAFKPSYRPQSSYQSSYRPQPSYKPKYRPQPAFRPEPVYRPEPTYRPEPAYNPPPTYNRPQSYYQPQRSYTPQSNYGFSNNNNYNPPAPTYNNAGGPSWAGHPASNVDIYTGSYSVNYKR